MEKLKSSWKQTHPRVRKPLVLVLGTLIILLSGTIGWLPGPGGIPLFLLGIAVLASEFAWADTVKNRILKLVHGFGSWYRSNRLLGTVLLVISAGVSIYISLTLFHVI